MLAAMNNLDWGLVNVARLLFLNCEISLSHAFSFFSRLLNSVLEIGVHSADQEMPLVRDDFFSAFIS